jgi:Carboxypeptidase regulatory-like domain
MSGMVQDAAGGIISGALIKLIRDGSDGPLTARTDDKGKFSMKSLSPGFYKVRIESPGFMTFTKEVSLRSHQEFKLSATLHVGGVGTVVEVLPVK